MNTNKKSSENAEPYARQKMKARAGGVKGPHLWPHGLSRRTPLRKGQSACELSWKYKVTIKKKHYHHLVYLVVYAYPPPQSRDRKKLLNLFVYCSTCPKLVPGSFLSFVLHKVAVSFLNACLRMRGGCWKKGQTLESEKGVWPVLTEQDHRVQAACRRMLFLVLPRGKDPVSRHTQYFQRARFVDARAHWSFHGCRVSIVAFSVRVWHKRLTTMHHSTSMPL